MSKNIKIGNQTFNGVKYISCACADEEGVQRKFIDVDEVENKLGVYASGDITSITEDDLAGVTKLKNYAFYQCSKLINVILPDSLTEIGEYVFRYCSNIKNMVIPENVTKIGTNALTFGSNTTEGKTITTMLSTTPPQISYNTFYAPYINKIIVPAGCGDAYKAATNWSDFADYIEEATE